MEETALLGILATLVGALIWVLKSEWRRSADDRKAAEKNLELRDSALQQTLDLLRTAVGSFQKFEAEEDKIHAQILEHLDEHGKELLAQSGRLMELVKAQTELAQLIERLIEKVDGKRGSV